MTPRPMKTAIVTGSSGLIGSDTIKALPEGAHRVVGIDEILDEIHQACIR